MHIFSSTLSVGSWGAYQRNDSGTRSGQRHNVEVVGQVELGTKGKRGVRLERRANIREGKRSGQCPLTSLVLQISPSVAPQAFPGVAFIGIKPAGSERRNVTSLTRSFQSPLRLRLKALWVEIKGNRGLREQMTFIVCFHFYLQNTGDLLLFPCSSLFLVWTEVRFVCFV